MRAPEIALWQKAKRGEHKNDFPEPGVFAFTWNIGAVGSEDRMVAVKIPASAAERSCDAANGNSARSSFNSARAPSASALVGCSGTVYRSATKDA